VPAGREEPLVEEEVPDDPFALRVVVRKPNGAGTKAPFVDPDGNVIRFGSPLESGPA